MPYENSHGTLILKRKLKKRLYSQAEEKMSLYIYSGIVSTVQGH